MRPNSSTKAKAGAKPRQNSNKSGLRDPPQFAMQPTNHRRLRFLNAASSDLYTTIFSGDLIQTLGAISTGTSLGADAYTIASSARIKSVDIWAAPKSDSDGAWQSAYVEWKNSTSFSKSTRTEDISISNARPLHVHSKPPSLSVSDLWFHGPDVELFTVKIPQGGILDLVVDYLLCDINEPVLVSLSATEPAGKMVYDKLDKRSSAALIQVDRGS